MSFVPQLPIDPSAVMESLRVNLQNNVHAGERVIDVTLDTMSDLAHQSAVLMNGEFLSAMKMQQSLLAARTYRYACGAVLDHGNRLRDQYFKYLDECFACHHRAMERLYTEDGYAGH